MTGHVIADSVEPLDGRELAELREQRARATAGTWELHDHQPGGRYAVIAIKVNDADGLGTSIAHMTNTLSDEGRVHGLRDALSIVALHNAAPRLFAAIETARAKAAAGETLARWAERESAHDPWASPGEWGVEERMREQVAIYRAACPKDGVAPAFSTVTDEMHLRGLIARVDRDGGHRQAKDADLAASVARADTRIAEMIVELEELRARVKTA